MSTFAVTRERIGEIRPIPKADRIMIATLQGMDFQFVVGKDQYQPGQEVLYIPIDSVLPQNLIEVLNLQGKLAGKEQNRVKTVVLRGAYSQGLVVPSDMALGATNPQDITALLGITKWNPAPNEVKDGILLPRPDGQSMYDIESADRYTGLAEAMMDEYVFITEKAEGENSWVLAYPGDLDVPPWRETKVGMRDNTILEKYGIDNRFHRLMKDASITDLAHEIARHYKERATVYGEFLGPGCGAGNYYDLKKPTIKLFDIRVGMTWLPPQEFVDQVRAFFGHDAAEEMMVPILLHPEHKTTLRQWLSGRTIKQASDGMSLLAPNKRREGIVIKPLVEGRDDGIGRLVLKQRSPAYLANTDF